MSWQAPGADPPPEPAPPPDHEVVPSPDPGVAEPAPPPPPGLISAAPVGWVGPDRGTASGRQGDAPEVAWAPPARAVAPTVAEGLVIAGVFTRVVAYLIDLMLLAMANVVVGVPLGVYDAGADQSVGLAVSVLFLGIDALYFIGLWRSGWQATLGMRLLRLRVLRATDAGTLSLNASLVRWVAVSGVISIVALMPGVGGSLGLLSLVWVLALLLTTATNPLRQGLHDRWAGSVVVQPAPGGSGAAVVGCLVLVVLAFLLPLIALALAGDQLQEILSQVGNSI